LWVPATVPIGMVPWYSSSVPDSAHSVLKGNLTLSKSVFVARRRREEEEEGLNLQLETRERAQTNEAKSERRPASPTTRHC
jgi:hypothetical protein